MLSATDLSIAYDTRPIIESLNLEIRGGEITTIIGPNGCGKSTLLKALSRLLAPKTGTVLLNGHDIHSMPTTEVARNLGILSQQAETPDRITVSELVTRGRYPHQKFLQPPSRKDIEAVRYALELTGMSELQDRPVDEISGGQRQRAWIAMALAQETPLLLLDEPTTYLDVSHELEIMDLVTKLNREEGRTVVMVLHDINQAARVSDRIVLLRDGRIIGDGAPDDVLTTAILTDLYGVSCDVYPLELSGRERRFCVPRSRSECGDCVLSGSMPGFDVTRLSTGYGKVLISNNLDVEIPGGMITAILGPNACGKSTLLRTISRLQKASTGVILLDSHNVMTGSHKNFARKLSLLAQGSIIPEQLTVEELIATGRHPHQTWLNRWSAKDEEMVEWALEKCLLMDLRFTPVERLSGGQRQRVWFAMSLVQDTDTLLLDEPTTFLDISAQIDLLDIVWQLNRDHGKTIVMVLHDLNMAARYADHIIAMKAGEIMAQGTPTEVIRHEVMRDVYGINASILEDSNTGMPLMIPD